MAVYYVDRDGGSDSNGGTDPTTDAWLTLQHAFDTMTGGNELRIMQSTDQIPAATIDIDTNNGTDEAPIEIWGADSSGDRLTTGHAVISGNGLGAILIAINAIDFISWHRIRFTDTDTGYTLLSEILGGSDSWLFFDCRIDNSGSHGVDRRSIKWSFYNTEVDNNTGDGITCSIGSYGYYTTILNCSIHDNGGDGFEARRDGSFIKQSRIYNNTGNGVHINRYCSLTHIENNVFYNNTLDGVRFADTESGEGAIIVINNILSDNGGYGLNVGSTYIGTLWLIDWNCYYNNTSNPVRWVGTGYATVNGNGFGDNNVDGDPSFTSVVSGSEDFTLQSSSSCIDVGFGYGDKWDIGVAQSSPGGGGGDTYSPLIISPNGNRIGVREV